MKLNHGGRKARGAISIFFVCAFCDVPKETTWISAVVVDIDMRPETHNDRCHMLADLFGGFSARHAALTPILVVILPQRVSDETRVIHIGQFSKLET